MKKNILILLLLLIILCLAIILLIFVYMKNTDIESEEPIQIEDECEITTEEINGRKVFTVIPINVNKVDTDYTILYIHGGSYVAQMTDEHWEFVKKIAIDTNSKIIVPDYPLTPKYTYKDVFNMIEPLYKKLILKENIEKFIVMGDSAGGGLALALEEKMSTEDILMPSKTILISPWLDVRLTNSEIAEIQKLDKELSADRLKLAGKMYAGDDGIDSFLVNPIDGDLSKIKNLTIFTGTYDILYPDINILAEKAKEVNLNINIKKYEEAGHIWLINHNSSRELEENAYNDLVNEIFN